ncbi:MAG: orotate phosphoribosyltransferase [Methanothermobacter sp.]|jgi:orotate phosphoribosyltransferase|uniref:Orotate phosphoribosyltransferase n=1 Tax=Methanothermobacter thermautotrophicus (strain ATCC 29096 / DSM 1053 / JCM 10044 / NBRC 100330 / Delta H) TaxID=187420 RepID=PYRE_METTH|nr:orotate phosphoribosyltransferase [Methanothermobacter thermautotrophicus]O27888.1 RecName: Full=Orotate phosphoribosyltransferase; Short=OPRT; Short=OPRTase [Methanothermobacter thermautotrophicus str. Delta H]MDK2875390.1 orotate phosphoribosyltransferase [Methanothermobacter sp.]AAB86326.1 uridine 5'-monophosphate synthase [Methanothermobacter thermautotrophicus str. Delta H]MDN5374718.1 orotate phosphoribosyltransferase [Methanothermobacter sp.]WBF06314.1 orotate phosphoribosyltransfera
MQVKNTEELRRELIELLSEMDVVQRGKFILSSGRESDYYVDIKRAVTEPAVLDVIARLIADAAGEVDRIAGPALGAVPIATAVSLYSRKPLLMIRKEKKGYGTSKLIEGDLQKGDRVAVVEDVTTTGGSLLKAVRAIQENGGIVEKAFVIVDREEGAVDEFKREGITLIPLLSVSDFNHS